mgnify:FL=1
MPNWVYNTLQIEGDAETIQKVKAQLNKSYQYEVTDFLTNEKTVALYSNPIISFWNIVQPPEEKLHLYHAVSDNTADKTWGWYGWNNTNWGTKWDIGVRDDEKYPDTELLEETDKSLLYKFHTAWSPPLPAIEQLSLQYPELEMTLEYEEEQGWGGEIFWDSTGSTIVREWDIPNSHADYKALDKECECETNEDDEYWFSDCPANQKIELYEKKDVELLDANS